MPDVMQYIFRNKKANPARLEAYGFGKQGSDYRYRRSLPESGFVMTVSVSAQGDVATEIIDPAFCEPYTLHLVDGASGRFVGGIRAEYEQLLRDIAESCFDPDVFKTEQAKALIAYVRTAYGDALEFLWQRFPDNAIWRRKDTGKWYGALLTVSKRKLGLPSDEAAEIVDLRANPEALAGLIDGKAYYPGYHMNKKNWYTVLLDGSVPLDELCRRIDESYLLAVK